jgi:hypothetical protein
MNVKPDPHEPALLKGLVGLSRAITRNRMSGHPPAALLAAESFCRENGLPANVQTEVRRLVDLMVSGSDSIWYRSDGGPVSNAALFAGEPSGEPDEQLIPRVAEALESSLAACRDAGHNTIFASLALKALHAAPQYAFPSVIAGIVELLQDFEGRGPGVAHVPGKHQLVDAGEFPAPAGLDLPSYQSTADMIAAVCRYVIPQNFARKGVGGPIHLIDHAVALLDLQALGYAALVSKGLAAHHQHLRLWLSLPAFPGWEENYRAPCQHDPRTYAYWAAGIQLKDQGGYEHRLKFLYGAYRFAEHLGDEGERDDFLKTAAHLL